MKVTLLTEEEVFGENKLGIIKKYGTQAKPTDFAIATGVWVPDIDLGTGWYYLKTPYNGFARAVSNYGDNY